MNDITIQKEGDKWIASSRERKLVKSACKECVVKILLKLTAHSTKYDKIVVLDEVGLVDKVFWIGGQDDRKGSEDSKG